MQVRFEHREHAENLYWFSCNGERWCGLLTQSWHGSANYNTERVYDCLDRWVDTESHVRTSNAADPQGLPSFMHGKHLPFMMHWVLKRSFQQLHLLTKRAVPVEGRIATNFPRKIRTSCLRATERSRLLKFCSSSSDARYLMSQQTAVGNRRPWANACCSSKLEQPDHMFGSICTHPIPFTNPTSFQARWAHSTLSCAPSTNVMAANESTCRINTRRSEVFRAVRKYSASIFPLSLLFNDVMAQVFVRE